MIEDNMLTRETPVYERQDCIAIRINNDGSMPI